MLPSARRALASSPMSDIEQLKQLRQQTGISIMECKKALEEADGDIEKAKKILRERGKEMIKARTGKESAQGLVASYVHPGSRVGVLLELRCETDFVAKSEEFKKLAHEICLQIAAMKPLFSKPEDIPENFLDGERKIYQKQLQNSGKPQEIIGKIIEGKIEKYKKEVSLVSQPWVKDETKTIGELIEQTAAKLGEKIEIARFARYEI